MSANKKYQVNLFWYFNIIILVIQSELLNLSTTLVDTSYSHIILILVLFSPLPKRIIPV